MRGACGVCSSARRNAPHSGRGIDVGAVPFGIDVKRVGKPRAKRRGTSPPKQ